MYIWAKKETQWIALMETNNKYLYGNEYKINIVVYFQSARLVQYDYIVCQPIKWMKYFFRFHDCLRAYIGETWTSAKLNYLFMNIMDIGHW